MRFAESGGDSKTFTNYLITQSKKIIIANDVTLLYILVTTVAVTVVTVTMVTKALRRQVDVKT